jgi:hypothetical protein
LTLLAAVLVGLSLAFGLRGRKADEKDGLSLPIEDLYRVARWVLGKLWSRFHSAAAASGSDLPPTAAEGGEHGRT